VEQRQHAKNICYGKRCVRKIRTAGLVKCFGILRCAQDDGKNKQKQRQVRVSVGRSERSGFRRCAAHDETVSSFGRNDDFVGWRKKTGNDKYAGKCGILSIRAESEPTTARTTAMTNAKANAGVLRSAQNDQGEEMAAKGTLRQLQVP
jgi:hypothetical protein